MAACSTPPNTLAIANETAAKSIVGPVTDERYTALTQQYNARQRVLDERTARNDYLYKVAQHDCYARFFVNACLDTARDRMRDEKDSIRTAQLTLSAEGRDARKANREFDDAAKLAQQRAQAPARAANEAAHRETYEAKQRQHALDQASRGNDAPQRAANVAAYNNKQSAYQQKLDQARQNAAADALKRQQNVDRFQQKQVDAAQRQQALTQRQQQAADRAAAAAAASAASAPTASSAPSPAAVAAEAAAEGSSGASVKRGGSAARP